MTPRAWLDNDGEHFWWAHECKDVATQWADAGHPLDKEEIDHFQSSRNARMLPLGPNGWAVAIKDPLTITPSIQCGVCGTHGWIRNGEWVDA
jgi:hypothetical protein